MLSPHEESEKSATPVKRLLRFDSSVLIAKEIIYTRPAQLRRVFSGSISGRILVDSRKSIKTDDFNLKTRRFEMFLFWYAGDAWIPSRVDFGCQTPRWSRPKWAINLVEVPPVGLIGTD